MTIYTDPKNNRWFRESNSEFWPGQEFSIEIEKILYQQRSKYQDIFVFQRYNLILQLYTFQYDIFVFLLKQNLWKCACIR